MRWFYWISAVVAGIAGAFLWAWLQLGLPGATSGVRNGPWVTSDKYGRPDADAETKAAVAVAGLFALAKEETVYFTAFTDREGNILSGDCTYQVSGDVPNARWWSITLYGSDHYLVETSPIRYSVGAGDFDGPADFRISAEPQEGVWLPAALGADFSLTLRLYNPGPEVAENLAGATVPTIQREVCR